MDTSVTKVNAADNAQLLEEKKVVYSSNGKYDPQEINKLVKVYHMALEAGDNATVSACKRRGCKPCVCAW